jgi:hypothetical protein
MEWISIKDIIPTEGKDIMVIWVCEEDGCVGTTQCRVLYGKYLVSPGVFLQSNEIVKYWFEIPALPEDIEAFNDYHNPDYPEPEMCYE